METKIIPALGDQAGGKFKITQPRAPRVGDKCGRQVWETSGGQVQNHAAQNNQRQAGDNWETSVKSCGPDPPEWETSVGDKWATTVKIMRPRAPRMEDTWETSVKSCGPDRPVWETSGRQV